MNPPASQIILISVLVIWKLLSQLKKFQFNPLDYSCQLIWALSSINICSVDHILLRFNTCEVIQNFVLSRGLLIFFIFKSKTLHNSDQMESKESINLFHMKAWQSVPYFKEVSSSPGLACNNITPNLLALSVLHTFYSRHTEGKSARCRLAQIYCDSPKVYILGIDQEHTLPVSYTHLTLPTKA